MINKNTKFKQLSERMFLNEISYSDYKKDDSRTAKQKVNEAISSVNSTLGMLERVLKHNIKLKNEELSDNEKILWKTTEGKIIRIHERIGNIMELFQRLKSNR